MSSTLNRRFFLGASLASSTLAFGEAGWLSWLNSDAAEEKIYQILREYLSITPEQRYVARDLIEHLKLPEVHTETPATFKAMLRGEQEEGELERYVVEEFIAHSTFLLVINGQAKRLEMLQA